MVSFKFFHPTRNITFDNLVIIQNKVDDFYRTWVYCPDKPLTAFLLRVYRLSTVYSTNYCYPYYFSSLSSKLSLKMFLRFVLCFKVGYTYAVVVLYEIKMCDFFFNARYITDKVWFRFETIRKY